MYINGHMKVICMVFRCPCDQIGAQADPCGGVRGRAQGGVPEDQGQPKDCPETCHKEVVLQSHTGVWPGLRHT